MTVSTIVWPPRYGETDSTDASGAPLIRYFVRVGDRVQEVTEVWFYLQHNEAGRDK